MTSHRKVSQSRYVKYYYEIVAYSVDGTDYAYRRKAGNMDSPEFPVGDKLTLLYNPANPKKSRLDVDKTWTSPFWARLS